MIRLQRIHFVGIGGAGMSGIAEILLDMKYKVSGSDARESSVTRRLRDLGATVFIGHDADHLGDADAVVVSSAIGSENVEVRAARQRALPVVPRAEMLAELMRLKYSIAIAGTHGKTTTTSMVAMMLSAGGLDPTVIVGGRLRQLGSGARMGRGDYLVAEADESDGSFLKLSPTVAVITNIDDDHLEYYGDMARLTATFSEFANKVPFYGFSVLCGDDPRLRGITAMCGRRVITYGFNAEADVRAENVTLAGDGCTYDLILRKENLGPVRLAVLGSHNVANSLAAAAVGLELGLSREQVREGLAAFTGVDRRLQFKGAGRAPRGGAWRLFDDYGHHPTEISATLAAARQLTRGRLVVIFQPHRYSRTALLHEKFAMALCAADKLWLLPIYAAGEQPRPGVTSQLIAEALTMKGFTSFELLGAEPDARAVIAGLEDGDVVLSLGAGDVTAFGDELLAAAGRE